MVKPPPERAPNPVWLALLTPALVGVNVAAGASPNRASRTVFILLGAALLGAILRWGDNWRAWSKKPGPIGHTGAQGMMGPPGPRGDRGRDGRDATEALR